MHDSSREIVSKFVNIYVNANDRILDVGSCDVNGTFRDMFINCEYIGIDIVNGKNVDIIVEPYSWKLIESNSIDKLICGSVIEHVEYPWLLFKEIYRVLDTKGMFCITAPAIWQEHKHPMDCYRYYPDGMRALCKYANLTCIDTGIVDSRMNGWLDCYCYGEKQ